MTGAQADREQKMAIMRQNGLAYAEIGKAFGLTGEGVLAALKRTGLHKPVVRHRKSWMQENLLSRVEFDTNAGCWLYAVSTDDAGYGLIRMPGSKVKTGSHRYAWQAFIGDIPNGKHVLHKCDVRQCCNPNHLFLGSHADNMRDMAKKGRAHRNLGINRPDGERRAILVAEIKERLADGESGANVAKSLGVTKTRVSCIKLGKHWGYL